MMQIAFYKGEGRLFDKLIRWWTGGKYSHCELVFSDNTWFSADAWENKVRYTSFDYNVTNWDFVTLTLNSKEELGVRAWCDSKVGKKYDWLGVVLCQVLKVGIENPDRYWCSEVCARALQWVGKLPQVKATSLSPEGLHKVLS